MQNELQRDVVRVSSGLQKDVAEMRDMLRTLLNSERWVALIEMGIKWKLICLLL